MIRYCVVLILMFFLTINLFAFTGTIYLSDGQILHGKVCFSQSLYFWDIVRKHRIRLDASDIVLIKPLLESAQELLSWKHPEASGKLEIRYLLAFYTKKHHCYWGRCSFRVSIRIRRKVRRFILSKSYLRIDRPDHKLPVHIIKIINNNFPSTLLDQSFALSGKLYPKKNFRKLYAIHQKLGMIFSAKLTPNADSYSFPYILPGMYDYFIIGQKEIIFYCSMPERKKILDQMIQENSFSLRSWLDRKEKNVLLCKLLYSKGRYSDTKAIIMEEKYEDVPKNPSLKHKRKILRRYYLWICCYKSGRWRRKNRILLYQQDAKDTPPKLFIDRRLSSIFVPYGRRCVRYDYIPK